MPQALEDVELELREIRDRVLELVTRTADAIAALEAVRAAEQHPEAPAPPPSPPRPGPAADEPPTSAAGPTAAAAPAPDSSTSSSSTPARLDPRRARSLDAVRSAFRRLGPGWHGAASIAGEAGLCAATATRSTRDLHELGELEHNRKGGAHSRYRVAGAQHPPDPPPLRPQIEPAPRRQRRAELAPSAAAARRGDRERELGRPEATTISRRVRRELEREADERTAIVDRDDGVGTLPGRILEALTVEPAGVRGLARRLYGSNPTPELVTQLAHMLGTGDLVRHRNPDARTGAETHLYYPAR